MSDGQGGLLLAMMEPPPTMAEEFQVWYDTEHFPERKAIDGFVTANRFVCLEGFPRYLALYDLANLDVLDGPGFAAVGRNRYSMWTKRIIAAVWGHYRAEAVQIYPGTALLGAKGGPARLALWRFRNASRNAGDAILAGMQASFSETPGVLQFRLFRAKTESGFDFIALVDLAGPVTVPSPHPTAFGDSLRTLDAANLYTPYWR